MQTDTDIIDDLLLTADLYEDEAYEAELGHGTSLSLLCIRAVGEIRKLRAQIADKPAAPAVTVPEELRAALKECSDYLEVELNRRFWDRNAYPYQHELFELAMSPVRRAQALLQSAPQPSTSAENWPVRYVSRKNIKERVTEANPNPIAVHIISERGGAWLGVQVDEEKKAAFNALIASAKDSGV